MKIVMMVWDDGNGGDVSDDQSDNDGDDVNDGEGVML